MGLKVCKFGGSSVADGIQLAKIKEIVNADPERRYVVVSAPGKRFQGDSKITDLLFLCKTQKDHNIPYEQLFQAVCDRFSAIKYSLNIEADLDAELETIRKALDEGCSEDYIVSRGEYLSAYLIAAYLGFDFVDTKGLVLFDKRGRLMAEETNEALKAELAKHEYAVIPGFFGSDAETGEIKLLSRGGSDVTGSLVARAVDAEMYENWTDVSGLLMADPRIIDKPKPIERISYMELRELSYMGASVLHEDAVFPARAADIPINIRNTNVPEDPGTVITGDMDACGDKIISGIAGKKDFTVIDIYKNMMNKEVGFVRKVLMILEENHINFDHMPTGIDSLSVVIESSELKGKLEDVVEAFEQRLAADAIEVHDNISMVAVVGAGMRRNPGSSARILSAIAGEGVNLRMVNQSTYEISVILGIETPDFEKTIKAIYREFDK
ncbi:MAG: aspartate kinase [Firmicutes bacterium]|nr:aspartate kinase [Bacillota bacterium]